MKKTAVLGIGNILLRDDGIGVHVIHELQKENLKAPVDFIDGGTCILDLLDVFVKNDRVIIVDSLKGGYLPGTIYKVTPEELGNYIKSNSSLHDVQVLDIIRQVNLMGNFPHVVIIGIEPKEIFFDMELSETLKEQVPKIVDVIEKEIGDICA